MHRRAYSSGAPDQGAWTGVYACALVAKVREAADRGTTPAMPPARLSSADAFWHFWDARLGQRGCAAPWAGGRSRSPVVSAIGDRVMLAATVSLEAAMGENGGHASRRYRAAKYPTSSGPTLPAAFTRERRRRGTTCDHDRDQAAIL